MFVCLFRLTQNFGKIGLLFFPLLFLIFNFGKKYTSSPRYWYMSIGQYLTIFAFQYYGLLDSTNMF